MSLARHDREGDQMIRSINAHRACARGIAGSILVVALIATSFSGVSGAAPSDDVDPQVIRDWNATMVATIVGDAGKANAEAFMWFGFVQAAVYNAVEGITRDYELYQWDKRGPQKASPEAAAAAAAHDVLLYYYPGSKGRLDGQLATSLGGVTDGSAEQQGVKYGQAAAAHLIELRLNDGRNAPITFDQAPAAGVWRPTPPGLAPMFDPWLGQVKPMMMTSSTQFRPGPPPALTSDLYTADFNEVKAVGAKVGSTRTAEQTETALFTTDVAIGPYQAALRDLTARHAMDISDTARLFAAVDMSITDAIIAVWDSKYHYGFWRPITAIQLDGDGNPDTVADPTWEPFVLTPPGTPPYPDYVSGFNGVTGAFTGSLSRILGGGALDLNITSAAAGVTRHYVSASALNQDGIDGRVYLGIHFRTADEVAIDMGTSVANWGLDHYFQPT
jgi:hypothetical protein